MDRIARHEIDEILRCTASDNPKVRARALQSLCPCRVKRNEPRVWDRVLELASDPALLVRQHALHVLCDGSPTECQEQVVAAIEKLTQDSDPRLRRRARHVMAQYRRKHTINVL